jgi:hypothetical protein
MGNKTKKTVWEEALFETRYPSWILIFMLIIYALVLLIVFIK